jgi:hypothetical protein
MNPGGHSKRPKRHPLTPEEVADIIAFKKRKEHERLARFRRTASYTFLNIFNLVCLFFYLELLFCFYGPCSFERLAISTVDVHFGEVRGKPGVEEVRDLEVTAGGKRYKLIVNEVIPVPKAGEGVSIGKDHLLRKELKAVLDSGDKAFRLFNATPVLILSGLALSISFIAIFYNLNQNAYSLNAMSVLNAITLLGIILL